MTAPIVLAGLAAFALSLLGTRFMIWLAPRVGFVDKPGLRKIHHNPKPLGGGVAIFGSFAVVLLAGVGAVRFMSPEAFSSIVENADLPALWSGARQQTPLAIALLLCAGAMHVMGLIDDRRALGPYGKLVVQLVAAAAFVIVCDVRVLTALDALGAGRWPSIIVTVCWIVAITNAFNFLDNMDGLSSGVAVICAIAFFVTAMSIGQTFVAATLAIFIGSVLGFLVWNFPPSRIFMGDSGSLVLGFVLGVLTVRTTFLPPDVDFEGRWYAVVAPLIVLALPLYDLIVVSLIRLSRGKSPFVGDTNHFSHRLVARGMSRRTAVLCIYLVTFATSIAAILLTQVKTTFGASLIFMQTILVLGVVALLEQHPLPAGHQSDK